MPRRQRRTLWRTQNFLADTRLAERLVSLAGIGPADQVYDLGAGGGGLTAALAKRAGHVVAVERDAGLAQQLRRRFADHANVTVLEDDLRSAPLPRTPYVVVANPPFDITADLVRRLTGADMPPRDAYLVLQREAALRFAGRPRMTLAALLIAPWFSHSVLHRMRRSDFVPAPSVDTVFVRLHKRGPPLVPPAEARLYRDLVAATFTAWRPSLGASLRAVLGHAAASRLLRAAGIAPTATPSRVRLDSWLRLFEAFRSAPLPVRRAVAGAAARQRRRQRALAKIHRTRVPRDALGAA